MSKESIASSISSVLREASRSLVLSVRDALANLKDRTTPQSAGGDEKDAREEQRSAAPPDERLLGEAEREILAYHEKNRVLLDRAERYGTKYERLSESGTPSEIARNRAERARAELRAGLEALRDSFLRRHGEGAREAFDHALRERTDLPSL